MFGRKRDSKDSVAGIEGHRKPDENKLHAGGPTNQELPAHTRRRTFRIRTIVKEQVPGRRHTLWWDHLGRELRSAVRSLARERALAVLAVLLIGLGAGLLTAMFALVDAVILRKLDVSDPDSLIYLAALREGRESSLPYALFERLRENLDIADALWPRLLAETIPPGQSLEEWTRTAGAKARVLPGSRGLPWTDSSLPRATVALFVLAGLVLLAMCSNLAGLLLSRGLSRQTEYAVRMALGATRVDVLKHGLAEVFVLSLFGGAGAILLTGWLTRLCSEVLTRGSLGIDYGVRVDGRVLAFALAAALATAVAAQLMAALRFSSVDVGDALRLGRLTTSTRLVGRKALLAVQVAAAMVLVSGSVLFARTLQQLARVDGGFRPEGVLVIGLTGKIPRSEAGPEFFQELLRRVRAIPSVTAAGLANRVPMEWNHDMAEPIAASDSGDTFEVKSDSGCAWPGFFEALKIPVVAGRDFRDSDRDAVILTRELTHDLFPGVEPLGRYVRAGKAPQAQTYQVIGIIGDVRFRSPRQEETRMFFAPCRQVWKAPQTKYAMTLAIRAQGAPASVESAVRREIEAMGKQAVYQAISLEGLVSKSTRKESILATIATGFGAFTLVLTCAGVYALIDLAAAARRRELGIRMALGANGRMILLFMLKDLAHVIVLGACAGLVATIAVARLYRTFLYGMAEFELLLMSASLAIVLLFALAAALLPAWRASRLDPGSTLRLGTEGR